MTDHGPISPEYSAMMNDVAKAIDRFFNGGNVPKTTGFCLLVFPFGENDPAKDRINYISNAEREDMIVAMKEFLARAEGRHHEAEMKQ